MEDLLAEKWGRAVLLEYVFLEVVTVLLARRGLETASNVGSILLNARETDFLPCSEIFPDAWRTFLDQGDSRLSLTDAAIVCVARDRRDGVVATFDKEFRRIKGVIVVPN